MLEAQHSEDILKMFKKNQILLPYQKMFQVHSYSLRRHRRARWMWSALQLPSIVWTAVVIMWETEVAMRDWSAEKYARRYREKVAG